MCVDLYKSRGLTIFKVQSSHLWVNTMPHASQKLTSHDPKVGLCDVQRVQKNKQTKNRKRLDEYGLFGRVASRKSLLLLKTMWQHGLDWLKCIWTRLLTRPRWRCLAIMHSTMFGENEHSISRNTNQLSDTVVWSLSRPWPPLCTKLFKCEAICLSLLKLGLVLQRVKVQLWTL